MNKYLRVTMPDGSKWDVPAQIIAENYAAEYGDDPGTESYATELANCLKDDSELKDWAANNMNWADVEASAVRYSGPTEKPDYQEGWVNGNKEMVEKP